MKLPASFVEKLILISNHERIPAGTVKSKQGKELLSLFLAENVLQRVKSGNTFLVYTNSPENLRNFIRERFGIQDLTRYVDFLNTPDATKSDAVLVSSDSKVKNTKVYSGFFIRTYVNIDGRLNDTVVNLKTIRGTSLFISDYRNFSVPDDVTIVGIENPETFFRIEDYKYLFKGIKPLFLLRFNNKAFIEWLKLISNPYLHFGDFDLSAIAIYILEFRNHIGAKRCDYLIPENIEELIINSRNYDTYVKQLNDPRIRALDFNRYPEVKRLADLIIKNQKTLEQEALMKKKKNWN